VFEYEQFELKKRTVENESSKLPAVYARGYCQEKSFKKNRKKICVAK